MITSVSEKAIVRALTVIEGNAHRRGWDNSPPAMFALYRRAGTVLPGPPIALPGGHSPGQAMARLAPLLWRDGVPGATDMVGVAFCCEAWMATNDTMSAEEMQEYDRGGGPPLADRVGSVEVRMAMAYDAADRLIILNRVRGKPPTLNMGVGEDDGGGPLDWAGRIPLALRLVMYGAQRSQPYHEDEAAARDAVIERGDALCEQIERGDTGIRSAS